MSDTAIKEDEKIAVTDDGDHDKFQHYFPKWAIDANLLEGKPMKAMCGKIVKSQVDPKGRTICQTCQEIYDALP